VRGEGEKRERKRAKREREEARSVSGKGQKALADTFLIYGKSRSAPIPITRVRPNTGNACRLHTPD
jgi:hypothetical protein